MSKSKIVHPYGRGGWRISGMEQAAVKTQLHGVAEVYLRPADSEMLLESLCPQSSRKCICGNGRPHYSDLDYRCKFHTVSKCVSMPPVFFRNL